MIFSAVIVSLLSATGTLGAAVNISRPAQQDATPSSQGHPSFTGQSRPSSTGKSSPSLTSISLVGATLPPSSGINNSSFTSLSTPSDPSYSSDDCDGDDTCDFCLFCAVACCADCEGDDCSCQDVGEEFCFDCGGFCGFFIGEEFEEDNDCDDCNDDCNDCNDDCNDCNDDCDDCDAASFSPSLVKVHNVFTGLNAETNFTLTTLDNDTEFRTLYELTFPEETRGKTCVLNIGAADAEDTILGTAVMNIFNTSITNLAAQSQGDGRTTLLSQVAFDTQEESYLVFAGNGSIPTTLSSFDCPAGTTQVWESVAVGTLDDNFVDQAFGTGQTEGFTIFYS
ncbi:hypothetical protein GGR50DRAFT_382719 [Xylaria sp. CBS 124048]|nr:hypothetical protein GGR50DRAFT_382719 [Xylaria sp. CBS 124048]